MSPDLAAHQPLLEEIKHDLSGEPSFPTCMDAAILLRDTLKDPEASLEQVTRAVSIDPLISSKVLRLANTAGRNASGKPVTSLGLAVSKLGFESVRTISLAVALDQLLKTPRLTVFSALARQTWLHSLNLAAIARVLARRLGKHNPDEAMLCGMVSQIGTFYLLYRAADKDIYISDTSLLIELLKGWQLSTACSLLRALSLPERVIAVFSSPPQAEHADTPASLQDILMIANLLTDNTLLWMENSADGMLEAKRQIERARYIELLNEASSEIEELRSALS